jgi:hypothetical protein
LAGRACREPEASELTRFPKGFATGTRQSRSCSLSELEPALRVAGVVAVGGGDVAVAVQAQEADGEAAR